MDGQIPIVFGVDVEPDVRPIGKHDPIGLVGLAACIAWLDDLRPRLSDSSGTATVFSWFLRMDPQIEALAGRADAVGVRASTQLDELVAQGDLIGLHTHCGRWDPHREGWVADHADAEWVSHCVRTAFAAYAATFGAPCARHRFGDRFTSPAALDLIASLGARVDLTIEPGKPRTDRVDVTAFATGEIPSYRHLHSVPTRHGESLWQLPLTAADPGPALPVAIRLARHVRFAGQPLHRPLTLYRAYRSADAFWDVVERLLDELPIPYIALIVRSDLPLQPQMAYAEPIMDALLRRSLARRLRFTDPLEIVGNLAPMPELAHQPVPA